jgi:hypothetical protein
LHYCTRVLRWLRDAKGRQICDAKRARDRWVPRYFAGLALEPGPAPRRGALVVFLLDNEKK